MTSEPVKYDFIVVGAGPSGASVAAGLAQAYPRPSILLLEAGGDISDAKYRIANERHIFWATPRGLDLDYGYQTVPQEALRGRRLPYHRGKGLGGSTATNLGVWDYGSKPEYDEWAGLVGDDCWRWENATERFKQFEKYKNLTREEYRRYVDPAVNRHGTDGPVDITHPGTWDPYLPLIFEAVEAHGHPLSPDLNSDHGIGFGLPPSTIRDGVRVTAASSYLEPRPQGLTIHTNAQVAHVLFDSGRATGVTLRDGRCYYASKDVILCAGAIDTPKILLLSGVGPAEELAKHDLPLVAHIPGIGAHLIDHPMIRIAARVIKEDPRIAGIHDQQPSSMFKGDDIATAGHGYFKLDGESYPEFTHLSHEAQKLVLDPRSSSYEMLCRVAPNPSIPGDLLWVATIVMMNNQSSGQVSLQSSDPADPPKIDLNFLDHPYDVRTTIEALRKCAELLLESRVIPTDPRLALGPQSLSDEAILAFIRDNLTHLWHAAGTVKMGKEAIDGTCVTPDFRVVGLQGLRVADLSVLPIMPSNHTQSTAYLIGETAADKIAAEYGLRRGEYY